MLYLLHKVCEPDGTIVGGILYTYFLFIPIRFQTVYWELDENNKIEFDGGFTIKDIDIIVFMFIFGPFLPLFNTYAKNNNIGNIYFVKFGFRKEKVLEPIYVNHFINNL